jgi:hypothetical protein
LIVAKKRILWRKSETLAKKNISCGGVTGAAEVEWAPGAAAGEGEGVAGAFRFACLLACDSV